MHSLAFITAAEGSDNQKSALSFINSNASMTCARQQVVLHAPIDPCHLLIVKPTPNELKRNRSIYILFG